MKERKKEDHTLEIDGEKPWTEKPRFRKLPKYGTLTTVWLLHWLPQTQSWPHLNCDIGDLEWIADIVWQLMLCWLETIEYVWRTNSWEHKIRKRTKITSVSCSTVHAILEGRDEKCVRTTSVHEPFCQQVPN